ncbi:MAG: 4Fe-4S binding protein [Deltaproteobacteria bacterium]|nr:4Fe-4S binding protein [Deltaproteobacteria bacterium]
MPYQISQDCVGCGSCAKKCPADAISGQIKVRFDIDPFLCTECGTCFNTCPRAAVLDPQGNRAVKKGKKQDFKARINPEICACCRLCYLNCPQEGIKVIKKSLFTTGYCEVDTNICVGCGQCTQLCITGAIELS